MMPSNIQIARSDFVSASILATRLQTALIWHGDAVNVAARLQAECPPGGICVTRSVRDHVHGRLDLAFEELGPLNLKNINRPVAAFVVRIGTRRHDREMGRVVSIYPIRFPATARQAVDRGSGVYEHERRCRAGCTFRMASLRT